MPKNVAIAFIPLLMAAFPDCAVHAHGDAPWGVKPLAWTNKHIERVVGIGHGQVTSVGAKPCIVGQTLAFDVRDSYAFDIDESVSVDVEFYEPPRGAEVQLTYNKADRETIGTSSIALAQEP